MADEHDQIHVDEHEHERIFYIGAHRLEAPESHMKVSELKQFIINHVEGFNIGNTLVLEENGDRPDKPLYDDEEVDFKNIPHFYDQPPANFGLL